MDAFFMISGAVLFCSNYEVDLSAPGAIAALYSKRLIGIYPAYMARCLYELFCNISLSLTQKLIVFPMDILMLQSVAPGAFNTWHHGGTWFVSCLFFCYLMTPFLVPLTRRFTLRAKVCIAVLCYAICGYMPWAVRLMGYGALYSNVVSRCLQFFIGILLAGICRERMAGTRRFSKWGTYVALWIALAGGVSVLDSMGTCRTYEEYDFFVIPIFALLIFCALNIMRRKNKGIIGSRIFRYANQICYEFFLVQIFAFRMTNKISAKHAFLENTLCKTFIAGMIAIGLAILLHELVTTPCKKIYRGEWKK